MTLAPRWLRLACGLALCIGASAGQAQASEDAGARSVFAQGAGNRALGMGGAFTAVGDDASAMMWNPGGLGRVSRLELQAGQTRYFDLGVSEAYFAAAIPNWRWGAVGLTFRHFGVDGIEGRDSRNFITSSDLSDSETEFSVGYGRPYREAWNFGGVVKARRQSLAGLSANGVGVDVGMTVQPGLILGRRSSWAQNLTWGVSFINLVPPSLRLVRESVTDPATVHSGFAYRHQLMGLRNLTMALDFEKSGATDLRLHAGAELQLHPALALRAGLNRGVMTAGTGIRWRDFGLDYMFEGNQLDGIHRIGLAFGYGATVAEARAASIRSEEQAIEARMAEVFQRRQAEQITSLLVQAEERIAAQQYDEALEPLTTILALEPGHAKATGLQVVCFRAKGQLLEQTGDFAEAAVSYGRALALAPQDSASAEGQRRAQSQGDVRAVRSSELRQEFAAALDAFGADRLIDARTGFRRILAANPSDEEAALMLKRTEQAISRRTQNLIKQSQRNLQANLLNEAAALLEQAAALNPRAEGLAPLTAALARARLAATDSVRVGKLAAKSSAGKSSTVPGSVGPAPLSREKQREVEMLYRRGLEAMKERRTDDALRYWELVWSADRNYQGVAAYLKREYLTRGMESFAAGRLDEAVDLWQRALKVDPNDERAKGYLARAQKQLVRTREILGASE